jgi:hypothetical protein
MAEKRVISVTASLVDELKKGEFYLTEEGRVYKVCIKGDGDMDRPGFSAGHNPSDYLKDFIKGYLFNRSITKTNFHPPEKFSLELSLEKLETTNPSKPSQQSDEESQR